MSLRGSRFKPFASRPNSFYTRFRKSATLFFRSTCFRRVAKVFLLIFRFFSAGPGLPGFCEVFNTSLITLAGRVPRYVCLTLIARGIVKALNLLRAVSGTMTQAFPLHTSTHIRSSAIDSISMIGNLSPRRWAWNPFIIDQDFKLINGSIWERRVFLEGPKGVEHSANFSFRLTINHNSHRHLKASDVDPDSLTWVLAEDHNGSHYANINFYLKFDSELLFRFDSATMALQIIPMGAASSSSVIAQPLLAFGGYELNGFVWDDLSMFDKFLCRRPGRSFVSESADKWSLDVPLRANGGIDFRADGVYQFLISADGEEDYGFSALNDGTGRLVRGTGFGSSHGSSMHSGCTIKVKEDGLYRFLLDASPDSPHIKVIGVNVSDPEYLNLRSSIQLLGTVYADNQFDPTVPGRSLLPGMSDHDLVLDLDVKAGKHCINFGIGSELFLDTMGFGCWLDVDPAHPAQSLRGIAWHGKPQEWNILFELDVDSKLRFTYNLKDDAFGIDVLSGGGVLTPTTELNELSLVGNFPDPLKAWDPESPSNLMEVIGGGRFQRTVLLQAGETYTYKYVANRTPWQMVFADYELDCHGTDFTGSHPSPGDVTVSSLKRFGRLTSHGNPPALSFTAIHTGPYRFYADVITGGYGVKPV